MFAGPYTATVAENAVSGALVRSLAATDVDGDVNPHGHRTYAVLSGNTGSRFTLDPATGSVNVGAALDRETTASYLLVVQAVEECGDNTASTTLTITISDVDDNPPTCTVLIFSEQVRQEVFLNPSPLFDHSIHGVRPLKHRLLLKEYSLTHNA